MFPNLKIQEQVMICNFTQFELQKKAVLED